MNETKPMILLTGRSGQLGAELLPRLEQLGRVIAPRRAEMDLSRPTEILHVMSEVRPQVVVNAAAYTAVDKAENDGAIAQAVNAEAPTLLAEESAKIGAALMHFSTDYVFDGAKQTPYQEGDTPHPRNVYGRTKLAGEEAIRASGVPHLIFRSSWIYANRGKNFPLTILRLAAERDELRIVDDQIGAPTLAAELASGISKILAILLSEKNHIEAFHRVTGTYHISASGATSWYEFAKAIIEGAARNGSVALLADATTGRTLGQTKIIPVTTEEFGAPAERPRYSVLSNDKLQRTFGIGLPGWREQLQEWFAAQSARAVAVSQLTSS
jgi:dTDP-4-dehydrorhamnose reductase